jgi:serine/threonine-protein kinase RsbT
MSLLQALEATLCQHVSAINARVIVERSRRVLSDSQVMTREDRARLLATVRATLRLFTSDERASMIVEDVDRRLSPSAARVDQEHHVYVIQDEDDLRAARAGARDMCLSFAASSSDAQRIATAVSELARNIIAYTPGGQIDLTIRRGPPLRISLVAEDRGTGIPHLQQILDGKYQSKTGLGRGLLGVKRIMPHFKIHTGAMGTRIEAEVTFS